MIAISQNGLDTLRRRLQGMGIDAFPVQGGRSLLGRIRLQRSRFQSLSGGVEVPEVFFATIGSDRFKCLRPALLFGLPILRLRDCRDATAIEARIHLAWQQRRSELERADQWLRGLGITPRIDADGALLSFPLSGVDPGCRVCVTVAGQVILPSRGPLTGISMRRPEDRIFTIDPEISTAIDLELAITQRLEDLATLESRISKQRFLENMDTDASEPREVGPRHPCVLLVGPRMSRERGYAESLRLRGYRVTVVPGEREAIEAFDRCSPELVVADVAMGRSEGIDLVVSLRHVPGVEEIPVLLVDDHRREDRREAARRVGAAGYLVHPLDLSKIASRLESVVRQPRRRRFTRYRHKVSVHLEGHQRPSLATDIGRGGMFIHTEEDVPTRTLRTCLMSLPVAGEPVRVETEVLYHSRLRSTGRPGVGVRFHDFPDSNEPVLIDYLRTLAQPAA